MKGKKMADKKRLAVDMPTEAYERLERAAQDLHFRAIADLARTALAEYCQRNGIDIAVEDFKPGRWGGARYYPPDQKQGMAMSTKQIVVANPARIGQAILLLATRRDSFLVGGQWSGVGERYEAWEYGKNVAGVRQFPNATYALSDTVEVFDFFDNLAARATVTLYHDDRRRTHHRRPYKAVGIP
jgi:hypothetical protein